MGSLVLRQAKVGDALGIAQVHVGTWQNAYLGMIPETFLQGLSVEQRAQNWVKVLESSNTESQTIVAEMDEVIVGFIGIGPSRDSEESDLGEVFAIYVDPNFQNQGVGSKLMNEGIQFLKNQGLKGAVLWVLDQNIGTKGWYESHGWEFNGEIKTEKWADFELLEHQYAIDF